MFEERDTKAPKQGEFWGVRDHLPAAAGGTFYRKLDETLHAIDFGAQVREICRPAYQDTSAGGRPGIDPVVYFKMLMIGFFENLPSERSIASRCEDSLSLPAFHGYDLTEATPDHSSLSVIRTRMGAEVLSGSPRDRAARTSQTQAAEGPLTRPRFVHHRSQRESSRASTSQNRRGLLDLREEARGRGRD